MAGAEKVLPKVKLQGDDLLIFITVGTQKFQFDRLFKEMDRLKGENLVKEEVVAQIGVSTYIPKNYKFFRFSNSATLEKNILMSRLVITHAGTSSIIQGLRNGKRVLVVPRRKKFAEHVDDHQMEIAKLFKQKNYVDVVDDISELEFKIKQIKNQKFDQFEGNNFRLIHSIKQYLLANIS